VKPLPEAELFEAGPSGWHVPAPFAVTYALYAAGGVGVTAMEWGWGFTFWKPLFPTLLSVLAGTFVERLVTPAIVFGLLAAFELIRQAEWRSHRYTVRRFEVTISRGLLLPHVVGAFPSQGARLRGSPEGPTIETAHGSMVCRALAPHLWADLAQAVMAAGGTVAPDFFATAHGGTPRW
jgi:hypothetical protein